jgi:DNA-binding HxlR family transcriptional regulator
VVAEQNTPDTVCPVELGLGIVGDRWSVLILRELLMGNKRFDSIQAQTGATPQMLASRLKKLGQAALIQRRPYQARPVRFEYELTEMGSGYFPIINSMRGWGETWCKPNATGPAVEYVHSCCGNDPGLGAVCQSCGGEVKLPDITMTLSSDFERERNLKASR